MSTMTNGTTTVKAGTRRMCWRVEITDDRGQRKDYTVRRLRAEEMSASDVRGYRLDGGEGPYVVALTDLGIRTCTCKGHVQHHHCKHADALAVFGLVEEDDLLAARSARLQAESILAEAHARSEHQGAYEEERRQALAEMGEEIEAERAQVRALEAQLAAELAHLDQEIAEVREARRDLSERIRQVMADRMAAEVAARQMDGGSVPTRRTVEGPNPFHADPLYEVGDTVTYTPRKKGSVPWQGCHVVSITPTGRLRLQLPGGAYKTVSVDDVCCF